MLTEPVTYSYFLGLKNLDIIKTAIAYTRKAERQNVDFAVLRAADDPAVIANVYAKGDTHGIFQFESEGITKSLVEFGPTTIDDVILMNAAYRPGPMQYIPNVTAVKKGKQEPNYIVPEMEEILGVTYGSAIYQEQIQQIFHNIAGFTMGEADIIRRAMSKKHLNELTAAKPAFVDGLKKKNAKDEDIETFWNQLLDFASYAFNHSHAAAYSVVSYYTAWLKHYHPAAFYAATMSYAVFEKIPMYAADCKAKNIPVLKPDMNTGVPFFAPTLGAKEIRYGLASVKGVANAAMSVYKARKECGPYKDFRDIILKSCLYGISSAALEALIKSGAADSIMSAGEHRRMYVEGIESAVKSCRKAIKDAQGEEEMPTIDLYEKVNATWEMPALSEVLPYPQAEQLQFERQYLGLYISGSPVEPHLKALNESGRDSTIAKIEEDTPRITLAGLVHDLAIIHRKSDGAPMAKFVLEDESGVIDAIMFTKSYAAYRNELSEGCVAKVTGRIDTEESFNGSEEVSKKQLVVSNFCSIL